MNPAESNDHLSRADTNASPGSDGLGAKTPGSAQGTPATDANLAGGHYAKKQIFCKDWCVAWSHRGRFQTGLRLTKPLAGKKMLDYGCGDGTFMAMAHHLFPEAVGADIDPRQSEDCARRFAALTGLSFCLTSDLKDGKYDGAFGLVTCMEVMEHCVEETLSAVIADLRRVVADDGTVIVSVPIEIGPSLVGKQIVRTMAGWRGCGDYKYNEKYTWRELATMVFAGAQQQIVRPQYGQPSPYHGHKGFNWRALRRKLEATFVIRRTLFSPLNLLGGLLDSQAWFVCQPRGVS